MSISKFIALYPTICHDVSITDSSEDFETLKSTIDDLKNSIQSLNDNLQESELEAVVLRFVNIYIFADINIYPMQNVHINVYISFEFHISYGN